MGKTLPPSLLFHHRHLLPDPIKKLEHRQPQRISHYLGCIDRRIGFLQLHLRSH